MRRNCYELVTIFVLLAFALLVGATNSKAARFQFGGVVEQFTEVTTAGATTTLTNTSTQNQIFTGSLNHTVTLFDATTSRNGWYFWIVNQSTGAITVNDQGSNLLTTVNAGESAKLILTDNGTMNGSWQVVTMLASGVTFDIDGLTDDALIATGDFMTYFDTVDGANRKIDFDDLKTAIATDNINRLTERAIATGDFISFYDAATNLSSKVDYDTIQTQIAATALNPPAGDINDVQFNDGTTNLAGDNGFQYDTAITRVTVASGTQGTLLYLDGAAADAPEPSSGTRLFVGCDNNGAPGNQCAEFVSGTDELGGGSANGYRFTVGGNPELDTFATGGKFTIDHNNASGSRLSRIIMNSNIFLETTNSASNGIFCGESAGRDCRFETTSNATKGQFLMGFLGSTMVLGDDSTQAASLRFLEQAAPSTPSANFGEVFMSSSSGELTIIKDDGSEVSLETQGGAATSVWDAILGSTAEVAGGIATHDSFDDAAIAIATGEVMLVLPGTHSCGGTLANNIYIKGMGRGSVLDCSLTIDATQSFTWLHGVKFTDDVVIATGSGGNVVNPVWFANGKGTQNFGDASGNANYIIQFEE